MLPRSVRGSDALPAANVFTAIANQYLKRLYDNFGNVRFDVASKLWQATNA
jgi:hypothetical protein